jgi:hypothetical protein
MATENTVTIQWFKRKHFEAFQKCAKFRPDLQVTVTEMDDSTPEMVHARVQFQTGGRTLLVQKMSHFIITSIDEFMESNN